MDKNNRSKIGAIASITLLTLALGCSPSEQNPETIESRESRDRTSGETTESPATKPISAPTHSLGEVISISQNNLNLQFTVNSTRVHPGKGVIQPNKGNQWVVVDTTIVNQGQQAQTFSVVSFEVIDSNNNTYEVALLASALEDIETPTGEISPGDQRQGQLVFEVPEDTTNLKLLFQPNPIECEEKLTAAKGLDCQPIVVKL
ncbi:hypothetical protein MC7420_3833 [Coleofasciculus chthonoplastes PCC 7420]|uniref:DUF4352 domain-containing protein n=1 Tax=Coleofasciculus chthonoplastes PCC 7420 TaxID=118168 RepID=B4VUG1_9CYAN|nr:DUF4352 domain-containing protein [Coleofasciculus chthonoplastes]EDX74309.1 hypothetical protein MC7420_3833 [Coleofasciculus chthonoplastes PCC 7420]